MQAKSSPSVDDTLNTKMRSKFIGGHWGHAWCGKQLSWKISTESSDVEKLIPVVYRPPRSCRHTATCDKSEDTGRGGGAECHSLLPGKAARVVWKPKHYKGLESILDQWQLQDENTEGRQTLLN